MKERWELTPAEAREAEYREAPTYSPAKDDKASFDADIRVWKLLDLIASEFESDPMSRQCFDSRIVDEAIALVKKRKAMRDPYNPFRP